MSKPKYNNGHRIPLKDQKMYILLLLNVWFGNWIQSYIPYGCSYLFIFRSQYCCVYFLLWKKPEVMKAYASFYILPGYLTAWYIHVNNWFVPCKQFIIDFENRTNNHNISVPLTLRWWLLYLTCVHTSEPRVFLIGIATSWHSDIILIICPISGIQIMEKVIPQKLQGMEIALSSSLATSLACTYI